jgi:hypothetical protein
MNTTSKLATNETCKKKKNKYTVNWPAVTPDTKRAAELNLTLSKDRRVNGRYLKLEPQTYELIAS